MSLIANLLQAAAGFGKAAVAHQGQQHSAGQGATRGSHAECTPCAANAYLEQQRRILSGAPARKAPARKR